MLGWVGADQALLPRQGQSLCFLRPLPLGQGLEPERGGGAEGSP